jgi:hypothetical protein
MTTQPNVENLRKQAKSLHKQLLSNEAGGAARVRKGLPRLSHLVEDDVAEAGVNATGSPACHRCRAGLQQLEAVAGPSWFTGW